MWIGCYSLDLYCDCAGTTYDYREDGSGKLIDNNGHVYGEFPHQYTAELGAACRSLARKAGWILKRDGSAICPKCSNK